MKQLQDALPGFGPEFLSSYVLKDLALYNWGPFGGSHRAMIDPRGTAIIGPTGSGKTTLVDAFMTLITATPRYNLASTGGHESDRDLMSYVRGVSGAGNNTGDMEHVARTGKTTTAIRVVFGNGSEDISFGCLLWIDSANFSLSELKRLWLFSDTVDLSMEDWLSIHHEGGARALKRLGRETPGLRIYSNKKTYLAQLRRFFEVGEKAFALLNRAAGLKQLNSIDEIFRELVLDDRSAFNRAAEVRDEFQDLAAIRGELETAREQQKSLLPLAKKNKEYLSCENKLAQQRRLLEILPVWFALAGDRLWGHSMDQLGSEMSEIKSKIEDLNRESDALKVRADMLKEAYLKAGGFRIEQLQDQIQAQKEVMITRKQNLKDYANLTRALGFDGRADEHTLERNRTSAGKQKSGLETLSQRQEAKVFELGVDLARQQQEATRIKTELDKIRARPDSNIPSRYQDFRGDLAQALDLPESQLPFVAEMVAVKSEHNQWRGAIERAIGANRLRILVPVPSMEKALNWVNHRDNRLHVRLLEAALPPKPAVFFEDGFTRKLNFKPHPLRESLKALLSAADRHCVSTPEQLRRIPHGMTIQGLMSGLRRQFEKQDQRPLNQGWMTGFSNKDRLTALANHLEELVKMEKQAGLLVKNAKQALGQTNDRVVQLGILEDVNFTDIDLPGAGVVLEDQEKQMALLTDPDSDAGKKQKAHDVAIQKLEVFAKKIQHLGREQGRLEERYATAESNRKKALKRIGQGLTPDDEALGEKKLPQLEDAHLSLLEDLERQVREGMETERDQLAEAYRKLQQTLVRLMEKAQKIDTGALVETGTELYDIPIYLERLRLLTQEGLPEKLNRFLTYLNQSSDQGVTQLLTDIQNEVSSIEERIWDLNQTLQRVDFASGRYLQLHPARVVHTSLKALETVRRRLRAAALKDDQGESHYKILKEMINLLEDAVEKKRTLGARALLDPRYRLKFEVSVLERTTDAIIETRTGSQGGSGGEKEIIASYILTASLSYALCPDGGTRPLFSTIVLDEAFSKSSQVVAGRIIRALEEFGLHPLFVTPNKEMRLLRSHTRSAILAHRKGKQATLTSLSWEELEAHAVSKTKE